MAVSQDESAYKEQVLHLALRLNLNTVRFYEINATWRLTCSFAAAAAHFAGGNSTLLKQLCYSSFSSFLLCLNTQHSNESHHLECSLRGAMADKCIRSLTTPKGFIERK